MRLAWTLAIPLALAAADWAAFAEPTPADDDPAHLRAETPPQDPAIRVVAPKAPEAPPPPPAPPVVVASEPRRITGKVLTALGIVQMVVGSCVMVGADIMQHEYVDGGGDEMAGVLAAGALVTGTGAVMSGVGTALWVSGGHVVRSSYFDAAAPSAPRMSIQGAGLAVTVRF